MFRQLFAAGLLALGGTAVMAEEDTTMCSLAGPGMQFCAGEVFQRLDAGATEGMSFWLHSDGFVTKVLAEESDSGMATQTAIEARIIAMVDAQAGAGGHGFEFVDLDSRSLNGAPFGTLTYRLQGAQSATTVLHSYAALDGVVVQVLSQIAPRNRANAAELQEAHFAAVSALKPEAPGAAL